MALRIVSFNVKVAVADRFDANEIQQMLEARITGYVWAHDIRYLSERAVPFDDHGDDVTQQQQIRNGMGFQSDDVPVRHDHGPLPIGSLK